MKKTVNCIFIGLSVIFCAITIVFAVKLFSLKNTFAVEINGIMTENIITGFEYHNKNYVPIEEINGSFGIDFKIEDNEMNIYSQDCSLISKEMAVIITNRYYQNMWGLESLQKATVTVTETDNTYEIYRNLNDVELDADGIAVVNKKDGKIIEIR